MTDEILERNTQGGDGVLETLEGRLRREEPGGKSNLRSKTLNHNERKKH